MIQRFIGWWNKSDDNPVKTAEGYCAEEEEEAFYYETTLSRDLKRIVNLLDSNFPTSIMESVKIYESSNTVYFTTVDLSEKFVRETIPLVTLKKSGYSNSYESRLISYSNHQSNRIRWEAEYEEYEETYKPQYTKYAKDILQPLLESVEVNYKNQIYYYIFCKYEDSIHIVYNTLKDAYEQSGEVDDEVFQKSTTIIERLEDAMNKKKEEIDYMEMLQQQAVSKSLIDRLDNEIEFIDKYLEVN